MPSNNQPAPTKRVSYFNGQTLGTQDYIDEQKYHIDRQRRPYQFLHVYGICNGLTVKADPRSDNTKVKIEEGTAIDIQGQLIVLSPIRHHPEDLSGYAGKTVYIYICYDEKKSNFIKKEDGSQEATRCWEQPEIKVYERESSNPPEILLATLKVDSNGKISDNNIDLSQRLYSGVRLPSPNGTAIELRSRGNGRVELTGSLSVTGDLSVNGNVGIATDTPSAKLHIAGDLKLEYGEAVNQFSGDGTLGSNSDLVVPTQKAVKTYADKKALIEGDATRDFTPFPL